MKEALLAIARDALLDQLGRRQPRHALRLLVVALAHTLGRACQLEVRALDAQPAWYEGTPPTAPFTTLPVQRLGQLLGLLHVQGDSDAQTLEAELEPLLPALRELLHEAARSGQPAPTGAHADLIRAALAGADTFVWEWSLDNDWLSDIDEGLAQLGYTAAGLGHTQNDWNRLIHPEDAVANHEAYLRHARGEAAVYEHAYRIRAADGSWRWMMERGRIVEHHADGRPRRMVGTQTDITQRRAIEAAAQEALERLASIARSVPQVLFQSRTGADGRREFLYVSEHSRDVLGVDAAELVERAERYLELVLPEDQPSLLAPPPATGGANLVTEHRIRRPDGALRWLRVISTAQPQADGSTLWHGSMEDVTERRELERSRELVAQAQAASSAKTQFLARMSHELRTPLNAVLGFTQLLEIDAAEPPAAGQQRRLKLIREAGEHLLHMINDMLDLTRIESGGMALQIETVALRDLCTQTLDMVRALAEKAQVTLLLAPGADIDVQADRTRLRQVLLNLLTNAIKYNRIGGQVTVELSRAAEGRARLAVRDTGLGIGEADLPQIFEPFHRGVQAQGGVDGAGIGLAVTRALVQLMGGEVRVTSREGLGSVFSVELPMPARPEGGVPIAPTLP